jgi:hypothetical protein
LFSIQEIWYIFLTWFQSIHSVDWF